MASAALSDALTASLLANRKGEAGAWGLGEGGGASKRKCAEAMDLFHSVRAGSPIHIHSLLRVFSPEIFLD